MTARCPSGRFAAPVESAAYFVVAEALRRAPNGDVNDRRSPRDGERLVVERPRRGRADAGTPIAIEDRVGALGGTLIADAHHLRAELPCGS